MAGNRTLKLSILADTADLVKGLKTAENETESSSGRIGNAFAAVGKAAAAAGAAVAAYGVKLAIDGVKAALDDEKAQRILAQTLENTTNATINQIAAVEEYITATSLAVGVTDDQLRPAFSRLVRSTKDTEQAQKLLNLALNIASATGKPLELIANSLGKAYDGNTNALGRLGLGIDQNILKTKDFGKVYDNLREQFDGFAQNEANTFAGKIERLKVAFDEAKETIGFALLPILIRLFDFVNEYLVPIFSSLENNTSSLGSTIKNFLTPILNTLRSAYEKISTAIKENADEYRPLIDLLKSLASFVKGTVAPILVDVLGKAFTGIVNTVVFLIDKIGDLIELFARLGTAIKNSPLGKLGAGIADIFSGGSKAGLSISTLEGGARGTAGGALISQSFTDQLAESLAKPVAGVLQPITEEFKRNVIGLIPGNPNGVNNAWIESLKDAVGFVVGEQGGFGLFNAQGQLTGGSNPGNIRNIPGSVTINVNAPSVIDEEGFARAVGQALSNSSARAGTVEITPQFSAV